MAALYEAFVGHVLQPSAAGTPSPAFPIRLVKRLSGKFPVWHAIFPGLPAVADLDRSLKIRPGREERIALAQKLDERAYARNKSRPERALEVASTPC